MNLPKSFISWAKCSGVQLLRRRTAAVLTDAGKHSAERLLWLRPCLSGSPLHGAPFWKVRMVSPAVLSARLKG